MKNVPASLMAAAVAAFVAGAPLAGCQSSKDAHPSSHAMAGEKHACKGMNTCKGNGGCGTAANACAGKNACKGQGGCATVDKHGCKGQNACKGQGGCKSGDNGCAGKNSCKGQGGCAVPVHH